MNRIRRDIERSGLDCLVRDRLLAIAELAEQQHKPPTVAQVHAHLWPKRAATNANRSLSRLAAAVRNNGAWLRLVIVGPKSAGSSRTVVLTSGFSSAEMGIDAAALDAAHEPAWMRLEVRP